MKGMQIIALVLMGALFFSVLYLFYVKIEAERKKELSVSLPEEISQVKEGDTLYVTKVSDSIYIGFRKY